MVLVVLDGVDDFFGFSVGVVGVRRRKVCPDARPIDSLPPERVVREFVELVPRDLLCQEVVDVELRQDLRQSRGVTEHVREPHIVGFVSELLAEILLAIEELAHHRLGTSQVTVGLYPHGPDGFPLTSLDGLLDSVEEGGILFFYPFVLRCLRVDKDVLGIPFKQTQLGGSGVGHFLLGDMDGPQPGRVEVGMADGDELVLHLSVERA
jgi:hypothetical protein